MSLIKAIKHQLGLSVTPANNFTLTAEADNGTMKLARGNAGATTQDIMTVDAAGKVVFPQSNRTWQDVIGSRTAGVLYTNSTDREIFVAATFYTQAASGYGWIEVDGLTIGLTTQVPNAHLSGGVCVPVPPGATYKVGVTNATVNNWKEYR